MNATDKMRACSDCSLEARGAHRHHGDFAVVNGQMYAIEGVIAGLFNGRYLPSRAVLVLPSEPTTTDLATAGEIKTICDP